MTPEYMSKEFLEHYKYALDVADSLKMKMCLYDEYYFPSGTAGGLLYKRYPESISKRLDKEEHHVYGTETFSFKIPEGEFMGAVAIETNTLERVDLTEYAEGGKVSASLPPGQWKVILFVLNPDNSTGRNHVDYLDPDAINRFIELTYEKFYETFPEHFGTTIDFAFYDEPCLRWVKEGRTWTGSYNTKFEKVYGFSPVIYYPAMWYDIGPETRAARNMLFGFRAELYSSGFPKVINKWCNDHGIELTGHVDQEEVLNPVSICGDLMKSFKHQDIPCVDQIAHYGRASKIYKLISSAAHNYNKALVATECYGAVRNMPVKNLYKEAMDQFAKGINLMEPHAVWYKEKADIPPNLSPEDSTYGPHLIEYNKYIGRLQLLLQGGQHTSDIAILYPINTLQGDYKFQAGDPGNGGPTVSHADYMDIGEMLSLDIRSDYAWIHPETLDDYCSINENRINFRIDNDLSEYRVLILPGIKTIKLSNLRKIKNFYDQGGIVIASSVLPQFSVESGKDKEVRETISEIFGKDSNSQELTRIYASSIWNTGGFLPSYVIDGRIETSWRPSRLIPDGEWLEINFGREINPCYFEIKGAQSQQYSFRNGWAVVNEDQSLIISAEVYDGNEWIDIGKWNQSEKIERILTGKTPFSRIRFIIESGIEDKVAITEVNFFDKDGNKIDISKQPFSINTNTKGGKAYFMPSPHTEILKTVLDSTLTSWDVRINTNIKLNNGHLSYIHKKVKDKDIYFFANSSDNKIDIPVQIRGKMKLWKWNPHTGEIEKCTGTIINRDGTIFTQISLKLEPVRSIFFILE